MQKKPVVSCMFSTCREVLENGERKSNVQEASFKEEHMMRQWSFQTYRSKACDIIIQSKCTGRQETADSMDKDKDKMIETVIVLIMFEDIRMPMLNTILSETGFDAIGESDNVLTAVALRETTRRRSLPAEGTSTPSILGKLGSTHLNCSTLTSTWPRQGLKQSHTN